jgi:hypothetical protein
MECYRKTVKGFYIHDAGYVVRNIIPGRNGVRELEQRVVMAKVIGRKLKRKEVVHHINGDRSDNRPENLQLFESAGKHAMGAGHVVLNGNRFEAGWKTQNPRSRSQR